MDEEVPYLILYLIPYFGAPLFKPVKVHQKVRKFATKFSILKSTLVVAVVRSEKNIRI